MERRDIDNIVQGSACGLKNGTKIVKGTLHLTAKVGLWRAVIATADLTGDEHQITGLNGS